MALAAVIHAPKDLRIEEVALPALAQGQVQVSIKAGGICGSDLHYYNHGGFGTVHLREPMVLGHEVAGIISALGAGVLHLELGQTVAINPSRPCNACVYCLKGQQNHCLDMMFYGSAMRFPHVQGAFRSELICEATQAVPVAEGVSLNEAAFAEPLAVCLHGTRRAGDLLGKRVLITGAGPIGTLCVLAARRAGASQIVVTDIVDETLALAKKVGADLVLNTAKNPDALLPFEKDKGQFDVLFEASGNNRAFTGALAAIRPRGVLVQLGLGGDFTFLMNIIVAKEFDLRGTFRFHEEFATAVEFIGQRLVDVRPLLTEIVPLAEAKRGFELASDRTKAMKVQIGF
eukprot:gene9554-9630_t